jgi:hypothetical protein
VQKGGTTSHGYNPETVAIEEPIISMTEEGKNEPQLNKDNAHRVL